MKIKLEMTQIGDREWTKPMRLSLKTVLIVATALLSLMCCDAFGQTNGLPPDVKSALENADTFTLFSIVPLLLHHETNNFEGHTILGQTDVPSRATRMELIDALNKGITTFQKGMPPGATPVVPDCFNPRHGIRAKKGGETVELVICFECLQIYITSPWATNQLFMTTGDPAVNFNKVLRQAGLPLAPRVFYVGGEVVKPGPELYLGKTMVTEAIQTAGGFTPFAGSHDVWLRRADGTRIGVDVDKALKDATHDPLVYPGDQITVQRRIY